MSLDGSLLEGIVRQFPFLVDLSFSNYVDETHPFIAPDDRLVLLNEFLHLFIHHLIKLMFFEGSECWQDD